MLVMRQFLSLFTDDLHPHKGIATYSPTHSLSFSFPQENVFQLKGADANREIDYIDILSDQLEGKDYVAVSVCGCE